MSRKKIKNRICLSVMVLAGIALLLIETKILSFSFENELLARMFNMIFSRAVGSTVFIAAAVYFGYRYMNPFRRPFWKSLLVILPCFAVVINNFPIISFVRGDAVLNSPLEYVLIFAAECFFVALFEEFAFRGVIFSVILEKRRKNSGDVFISILLTSVMFGLIHILNILSGSDPMSVFLQIGYSFLIGGMCSFVLIETKNIWFCVIFHAVYNFGGDFMPRLGMGTWWDTPTVIITVLLSVAVTVYVVVKLLKVDPRDLEVIFC
jgi:membrane protease YdiL (CAAX protease family)